MSLENFERDINLALERNEKSNLEHLTKDAKLNVRDRNYRLAYDNILTVLNNLSENERNEDTDHLLKSSAEILERYLHFSSSGLSSEVQEQLLYDSVLAYYLSGNYARAYVLLKKAQANIANNGKGLMILFLLRELGNIRRSTTNALKNSIELDEQLHNQIMRGDINQDEAIQYIIQNVLYRAFFLLLQYIETGDASVIFKAIEILDVATQIAINAKINNEWWLLYTCSEIFREFHKNSLWFQLRKMIEDDRNGLVDRYIRHHNVHELWRSQIKAVSEINDDSRVNIALDMPTSSGKTLIAELVILRFLIDQWNTQKKCIYVAPFRALATQVEASLKNNLANVLNIRISELYGGFDVNPTEISLMQDTRIIIATPEKLDALLRYNPKFIKNIGLVVFDEGHIIEGEHRGLKYELFLHRVIRRLTIQGCRFLFASAVMPNIEQMAEILSAKTITTRWKPTELRLGLFEWNKNRGYRSFMYRGLKSENKKEKEPFVQCNDDFVSDKRSEIAAIAGVKFSEDGTTLIYSTKPSNVEMIASFILEEIERRTLNYRTHGIDGRFRLHFPTNDEELDELRECIKLSESIIGEKSIVTRSMKQGVAVHHGGVPKKLRSRMESLMQKGTFRLIVGNYALAQGVNLPVKTILIHHLHRGKDFPASDFWNICGRAGRAMQENYGEILWIADVSVEGDVWKKRNLISKYIARASSEELKSSLLQFLVLLKKAWEEKYPEASVVELCQRLADNEVDSWIVDRSLRESLDILDKEILAILEEYSDTEFEPSPVQELFSKSLMTIQLQEDENRKITKDLALEFLMARQRWVERIPFNERSRFYRTGLALTDCQRLSELQEVIEIKLRQSSSFMDWEPIKRAEYLLEICSSVLFELHDIQKRNSGEWLACWPDIVKHWVLGWSEQEIANLPIVLSMTESLDTEATMRVSQEIYALRDYRFPWGFDALINYFEIGSEDPVEKEDGFPDVVRYFSAMIRYGVHSPVAAVLCTYGFSRATSLDLSHRYRGLLDTSSILNWINSRQIIEIDNWEMQPHLEQEIKRHLNEKRPTFDMDGLLPENYQWVLELSDKHHIVTLNPGTLLVAECNLPNMVELFSPAFEYLGTLSINNPYVFEQLKQDYIRFESTELIHHPGGTHLKVTLVEFS